MRETFVKLAKLPLNSVKFFKILFYQILIGEKIIQFFCEFIGCFLWVFGVFLKITTLFRLS